MSKSYDKPETYTPTDYIDDIRDHMIGDPDNYSQDPVHVRRRKVAGAIGLMAVGIGVGVGGFLAAKHDKSFGQPEGPMEIPTNQHYSDERHLDSIYETNTVTLESEQE